MKADGSNYGTMSGPTFDKQKTEMPAFTPSGLLQRTTVLDKFQKKWTAWDRLFLKHINQEFGDNFELACRAACFTVICGLPFLVPKSACELCHILYPYTGFYHRGSVTYFLFTLYKTTGETIYFAIGGVAGTIFATFTIWVLNGFVPGGYTHNSPDSIWWIANFVGVLFVFALLYFNFDTNTKIFGISTYVWHWMKYINPDEIGGFAGNFAVEVDGTAISGLLSAISGCFIAVVAGYLPYPNLALWRALDVSKTTIEHLHMTWEDFASYYCGDGRNNMAGTVISEELRQMKSEVEKLDAYIGSAWYECLGLGRWQHQRLMMKRLRSYMSQVSDRLSAMIQVCLEEDWGDSHSRLMGHISANITVVIDLNGAILSKVLDAIIAGGFTEESSQDVNEDIDRLLKAIADLTTAFVTGGQAEGLYMLAEESVGENVVASNVCSFSALTCQFARDLQADLPAEVFDWREGTGIFGMFRPSLLQDAKHVQWTVRNGISILLAFAIGWHGVAGRMILSFNPAIASTVSVLLSQFVGTALVNNLNRLQGVVLGLIVGQVAYALLGWCTLWGHLSMGVTLLVWELCSLFVYYHSEQYSTVGLLLAVFGASGMLQGCSEDIFDPRNSFYAIINCTAAIFVMGFVDVVLTPKRVSDMARDDYAAIFDPLADGLKRICDPEVKVIDQKHDILAQIRAAAQLGREAANEPRYWRVAWPKAVFKRAIDFASTLRFCISSIKFSSTTNVDGKCVKNDHFIAATSLQSFGVVREVLLTHLHFVQEQVDKRMRKETSADVFETRLKVDNTEMSTYFEEASTKAMYDFMVEVNALLKNPVPDTMTLEQDPVAEMSLLVCFLQTIFKDLNSVQALIA